ncbi:MAG: YihY/virulence factor BrkB family protein [Bacteroidetes bacterium]|nr:YihY/virulence factor BrkB family protein [Bacteroidota bacterium]MBL6943744.1 YihY/virulence factor BrkB family protein [Bacteroidales bacterium]
MKKLFNHINLRTIRLGNNISNKLRIIVLPGFDGMPVYDVLVFFLRGLAKGVLNYRASAIAYNFFLALIPLILFLFTLIPYVTTSNFKNSLLDLMDELPPSNIFAMVESSLVEIISRPKTGLMSLGFLMAVYFATNGVDAILEGFNQSYHRIKTWPWWKQKFYAFLLMTVISFLGFVSMLFLTSGKLIITTLNKYDIITGQVTIFLLGIIQWLIIVSILLLSVSILYYFGTRKDKKRRYKFVSAGSILSTGLFIVGGLVLKLYFENFSNYNLLYGSIGSLIILLVWLYFNALIILIGFELNMSIRRSKEKADTKYMVIK